MNMNEKLDYSNLSAVELKAIMLCQMNCNFLNKLFPYP